MFHECIGLLFSAIMASFSYSSVLITGSNRGLGLNMIKHILNSSTVPKHIIATCRSLKANNSQELLTLAEKNNNLHVLEFDMANVFGDEHLPALVKQVSDIVRDTGLQLLINNAGMNLKSGFNNLTPEAMRSTLDVNTIAPCMLTKAFRPLLKSAVSRHAAGKQPVVAVINISSILGSIAHTSNTYSFSYGVSKAALNMATKAISGELAADGITVVSIHPGWVKTDMGGPNATLSVDESVSSVLKVIASLQKSQAGCFFSYDGSILPW